MVVVVGGGRVEGGGGGAYAEDVDEEIGVLVVLFGLLLWGHAWDCLQ